MNLDYFKVNGFFFFFNSHDSGLSLVSLFNPYQGIVLIKHKFGTRKWKTNNRGAENLITRVVFFSFMYRSY